MSVRLYIGNLPKEVERQELQDFFVDAGDSISVKVIVDRKTGKCRGFGFVTVKNDEQADLLIEKYNGNSFKESALKIEKAQPRAKGKKGEDESAPDSPSPVSTVNKSNRRSGGGGGGNRSRHTSDSSSSSSSSSAASGPDPRWATELEKLKEMLAAQATNS
jgi:RNA recognition motif-containing protein